MNYYDKDGEWRSGEKVNYYDEAVKMESGAME